MLASSSAWEHTSSSRLSKRCDEPNLSAYAARGGKILTWHGLADVLVPPQGTVNDDNRVATVMGGLPTVQNFYQLYPVPDAGHANASANPPAVAEGQLYALLTAWVGKRNREDRPNHCYPHSRNGAGGRARWQPIPEVARVLGFAGFPWSLLFLFTPSFVNGICSVGLAAVTASWRGEHSIARALRHLPTATRGLWMRHRSNEGAARSPVEQRIGP